jgi:hypothetical protein
LGDNSPSRVFSRLLWGKGTDSSGLVRVIDARFRSPISNRARLAKSSRGVLRCGANAHRSLCCHCFFLGTCPMTRGELRFCRRAGLAPRKSTGVDVLPTSAVLTVPAEATTLDIASRLGVRFVVRGAIRESKGQQCLSLEMFDAHLQRACFERKCEFDVNRLFDLEDETAKQIAGALNRPLPPPGGQGRPTAQQGPASLYGIHARLPAQLVRRSCTLLDEAAQRLSNAVTRDPAFSLAHATLSFVCATRHFEFDPASMWLDKAEFHCRRALNWIRICPKDTWPKLSCYGDRRKTFSISKQSPNCGGRSLCRSNLPHAYNRLGTILAHVGFSITPVKCTREGARSTPERR